MMSTYEIITLVISILSLMASILVSFAVFYMGKKTDEKRYRSDVEYQAKKFIIDHGDTDILYLPYCVIASGVNRHHKHLRKIYNDFDALPNDIQKEVLMQAGYDYELIENTKWIDAGLKEIEAFAKKYDLGDTFLYDGEKYFYRAFRNHAEALMSSYNEFEYLFEDKIGFYKGSPVNALKGTDKLSFSNYLESYYQTFVLNENSLKATNKDIIKPLDYLKAVKDFHNCDEEELCFWIMEIVSELSSIVLRTRHGGFLNDVQIKGEISRGDALPETFEDRYYEVLMDLYNLSLDEKVCKK